MDANYDPDGLLASSGDEAISMASQSQCTATSVNPPTMALSSGQIIGNLPSTSNEQNTNDADTVQRNGKRTATSPQTNEEKKPKNQGNLRLLVSRDSAIDQDFLDYLLGKLAELQDLIPTAAEQAKFMGFGLSDDALWIEAVDSFSLEWLKCSLNELSSASPAFHFTVRNFVPPPTLKRVVGVFPSCIRERLRPDNVLRNIARLNPELNTRFWRILALNQERSDGRRFLVLGVDDNSLNDLKKCSFKIFYRFTQISLKLSENKKKI